MPSRASLHITGSTIDSNTAVDAGAGLSVRGDGSPFDLLLQDSTVSANSVTDPNGTGDPSATGDPSDPSAGGAADPTAEDAGTPSEEETYDDKRIDGVWHTGFKYRTLTGHPELGEETFSVEKDLATGSVVAALRSWSRAGGWTLWTTPTETGCAGASATACGPSGGKSLPRRCTACPGLHGRGSSSR